MRCGLAALLMRHATCVRVVSGHSMRAVVVEGHTRGRHEQQTCRQVCQGAGGIGHGGETLARVAERAHQARSQSCEGGPAF